MFDRHTPGQAEGSTAIQHRKTATGKNTAVLLVPVPSVKDPSRWVGTVDGSDRNCCDLVLRLRGVALDEDKPSAFCDGKSRLWIGRVVPTAGSFQAFRNRHQNPRCMAS